MARKAAIVSPMSYEDMLKRTAPMPPDWSVGHAEPDMGAQGDNPRGTVEENENDIERYASQGMPQALDKPKSEY